MTAIKNGIKCTLRTPWKTILFSMVLVLLSALLTVSLCVFYAVRSYLSECNEYYHTIADLEFIGAEYPDASVYDEDAVLQICETRDTLDALTHADGVRFFEPDSNAVGMIDGLHRIDRNVYDPDRAVLRLYHPVYDERLDVYTAIVSECLYSLKDYQNKLILVRVPGLPRLESGKSYYAVGRFFRGETSNPWFLTESVTGEGGTTILLAVSEAGADGEGGDAYRRFAERLHLQNDCCRVQITASLEDYPPFQQQALFVTQGRPFTEQEYRNAARVCILSEQTAGTLNVGVGDSVELTVYRSDGALYEPDTRTETDHGAFTIVGLYTDTDTYSHLVFLPDAAAASGTAAPATGYRLGYFRLDNDRTEAFWEQAASLQEHGFRVSVYDQGYAAATEPMRELIVISVVFLAVCLILAIAAHALQSHLFVSRQSEAAETMAALGSGKAHVFLYFISAALLLAIVSSVLGCVIGKALEQRVMDALRQFALQFADIDLRFSDSRLSLSRTLAFAPKIPLRVYLLSAGTLLGGSVLFTLLFTARTLRNKERRKRTRRFAIDRAPQKSVRSSRLSGKLKYALLSMRRNSIRSLAVVLLCVIVTAFFGQLTASLDGYRAQLQAYQKNAVITGFATDMSGKRMDGLVIPEQAVQKLHQAGLLSSFGHTDTVAYGEILGPVRKADGTPCEPPVVEIPDSDFAYESLQYNLRKGLRWVNTGSVSESPLFYYAKVKDIRWLDGYSDELFRSNLSICALPQRTMEENGIVLGDIVRFLFVSSEHGFISSTDVKVVACYASAQSRPILFSPLGYQPLCDMGIFDPEEMRAYETSLEAGSTETSVDLTVIPEDAVIVYRTFDSFRFTLDDTNNLDALRDALYDAGFTYPHSGERMRPYAIIEDEMYLNTTHSMERQIQYVGILYNSLYLMAGVIGLVLAWLLTQSRRKEISVMRALGTQPQRILCNFLFEQVVLSAFGVLLGGAGSYLLSCAFTPTFLILCGAFWLLWNAATLFCLLSGLKKPSYASLTEPE